MINDTPNRPPDRAISRVPDSEDETHVSPAVRHVDSESPTLIGEDDEPDTSPTRSRASAANGPRYRVVREIGKGGMGVVFLARDHRLKRWVALKRLGVEFVDNTRARLRFENEARAIASLSHYHIVHAYEVDEDTLGPYIAMEFVAGPVRHNGKSWGPDMPTPPLTLEGHVKDNGPVTVEYAIAMGQKLCSALAYAHGRGLIHRDIKPANILLDEHEEPKIVDFGLARGSDPEAEALTMVGAQMLTIGYGAPEQEVDASTADHRADLYALGATLWYMVTGQSPRFFRESEVPDALAHVLERALQKDREKRFADAEEFLEALKTCSTTTTVLPDVSTGVPPGYWRCVDCGDINRDNQDYCAKCGAAAAAPCPSCTEPVPREATHCGHCGAHLERFLSGMERLRMERSARAHGHVCAAKAIARALIDEADTHPRQKNIARSRMDLIEDLIHQRTRHQKNLLLSLEEKVWCDAAASLVDLKPLCPQIMTHTEWTPVPEDAEFGERVEDLRLRYDQGVWDAAALAAVSKDVRTWAETSKALRTLPPSGHTPEPEMTSGDVRLEEWLEKLRATQQRLARREVTTETQWRELFENINPILEWKNFPDDKGWRSLGRELREAEADLNNLLPLFEQGTASPAQTARLYHLLPDHSNIAHKASSLGSEIDARYEKASAIWKAATYTTPDELTNIGAAMQAIVEWGGSAHHWRAETEWIQLKRNVDELDFLWPLWTGHHIPAPKLARLARLLPGNKDIARKAEQTARKLNADAERAERNGRWEEAAFMWGDIEAFHPGHEGEFVNACRRRRLHHEKAVMHRLRHPSPISTSLSAVLIWLALLAACLTGVHGEQPDLQPLAWAMAGAIVGLSAGALWRHALGRAAWLLVPLFGLASGMAGWLIGFPYPPDILLNPTDALKLLFVAASGMALALGGVWALAGDSLPVENRLLAWTRRVGLCLMTGGAWLIAGFFTTTAPVGISHSFRLLPGEQGVWPLPFAILLAALPGAIMVHTALQVAAHLCESASRKWGATGPRLAVLAPFVGASTLWVTAALYWNPVDAEPLLQPEGILFVIAAALTGAAHGLARTPPAPRGLGRTLPGIPPLHSNTGKHVLRTALTFASAALIPLAFLQWVGRPAILPTAPELLRTLVMLVAGSIALGLSGGIHRSRSSAMLFPAVAAALATACLVRTSHTEIPPILSALCAISVSLPLVLRVRRKK